MTGFVGRRLGLIGRRCEVAERYPRLGLAARRGEVNLELVADLLHGCVTYVERLATQREDAVMLPADHFKANVMLRNLDGRIFPKFMVRTFLWFGLFP